MVVVVVVMAINVSVHTVYIQLGSVRALIESDLNQLAAVQEGMI